MQLKLISHALCPYVQRAVIALTEKGVPYERIDIDLRAKPKWFLAMSPLGKTPVLQAGDDAIFESAVICEYLEDTIAPALHPADPLIRARHRAWVEFASSMLNTIWQLYTARDADAYDRACNALSASIQQLEKTLAASDGPYFSGDNFSLVDAAFGPVFRYFDVLDEVIDAGLFDAAPKVRAWRDALAQRPSVRDAVSAEYPALLRDFVIGQGGVLGTRLAAFA